MDLFSIHHLLDVQIRKTKVVFLDILQTNVQLLPVLIASQMLQQQNSVKALRNKWRKD